MSLFLSDNFEMIDAYADISYRPHNYYNKKKLRLKNKLRTNQIQIFFNESGNQTISVNDVDYHLVPGDLLIAPDWSTITINEMDEDSKHNVIQYDPGIFMESVLLIPSYNEAITNIRKYGEMIIHPRPDMEAELRRLFDRYDAHSGFGFEVMRFSTILLLLKNINEVLKTIPEPEYTPPLALTAVDYINLHFREDIKLEVIADEMSISKQHLGVIFKEFTSTTPKQYIDYRRINIAKVILKERETNVNDAFSASGYATYSSFYRTFFRFTGMKPDQYRNHHKNHPEHSHDLKFMAKLSDDIPEEFR